MSSITTTIMLASTPQQLHHSQSSTSLHARLPLSRFHISQARHLPRPPLILLQHPVNDNVWLIRKLVSGLERRAQTRLGPRHPQTRRRLPALRRQFHLWWRLRHLWRHLWRLLEQHHISIWWCKLFLLNASILACLAANSLSPRVREEPHVNHGGFSMSSFTLLWHIWLWGHHVVVSGVGGHPLLLRYYTSAMLVFRSPSNKGIERRSH